MYLDAMEFLEEERDAWAPFEALADLDDDRLTTPIEAAHGWSGRQLMAHLVAWQEAAIAVARELAVDETSPALARQDADWDTRGGEAVNGELDAAWAEVPLDEVRHRFRTTAGELRGYLTVVPETRWLKHAVHLKNFQAETIDHYEEHAPDLRAILEAAR